MKNIIAAIAVCILFSACSSVNSLILYAGFKKTKPVVKLLKTKGREVYFMQMRHIAKPAFYSNAKLVVDSLLLNNYALYAEGIGIAIKGKPLIDTVVLKKLRKILNMDITIKYSEMSQFQHFVKKHGLIFQPKASEFAKASDYKIVDISYIELVEKYEDQYEEIILDSCDLMTKLGEKEYTCNSLTKKKIQVFRKEFMFKARNKHVAQTISNSNDKKILVMYGAGHFKGLKKELRKLNE